MPTHQTPGRLANKSCMITGAARGIGATTARVFAREGAAVAVVDVKDDLGRAVVAEITAAGGLAGYFHCDVTRMAEVERTVKGVADAFGTVNVLFNNAGT